MVNRELYFRKYILPGSDDFGNRLYKTEQIAKIYFSHHTNTIKVCYDGDAF